MYDLPSELPGESGLPDEYHLHQARLLGDTFRPATYGPEDYLVATDLNLYFDPEHTNYYKRPDWYAVVGVPKLHDGHALRRSYVLWQEQVRPLVIVELLSPGTEGEDLGQTVREPGAPPTKWTAYAQYVKVPYYVVFDGQTGELQAFRLRGGTFVPRRLTPGGLWIKEVQLTLGIWRGTYTGVRRAWLRWKDTGGNWVPTDAEAEYRRAEQERLRAEQAEQRAEALARKLRELGLDPEA